MSLISDALKTAQRERSGQATPGSGDQPLLDGFFPYVSSSSPESPSRARRVALISVSSLVILGVAGWFGVPVLKRAIEARPGKVAAIVQPPSQTATTPEIPPAPIAQTADTQVATTIAPEPAPVAANPDPAPRSPASNPRKSPTGAAKSVVAAADTATARRDTAIAQPSAALPSAPDRRRLGVGAPKRNFETEAIAAFNAGDYPTARARFDTAVRVTPTASAWTNYGVTLEKIGDSQSAARAYRMAMGIDPNYFNAWLYLARLYNLLGDVTQAVPLFNRALEIEPTNSDVNADLAELEFKAGAFTDARRYADVAARSNPSNARAHYYLALSADTLKDTDVARRAFEDYLRTIMGQERENLPSIGYARMRLQALKGKP